MARRRRERMSEGKKNIITGLIQEYDIKTAEDIQEALKDLLGGTIQEMMEAELDEHLGYDEYARSDNPDYRNIAYEEARILIYKAADASFNPDTDMVGDFCYWNIPPVDSADFTIARKLLNEAQNTYLQK